MINDEESEYYETKGYPQKDEDTVDDFGESDKFIEVESKLMRLGDGLNKELVKDRVRMLVDNIKSITLTEATNTSESVFGRKIYKNIYQMFKYGWGEELLLLVTTNFSIEKLIMKRTNDLAKLQLEVIKNEQIIELQPREPSAEYYSRVVSVELRKWTESRAKVKAEVRNKTKRAAKAKSEADPEKPKSEGEKESETEGENEDAILKAKTRELEAYYDEKFVKQHEDYETAREKSARAKISKDRVSKIMDRLVILQTILEGLQSVINLMANKTKAIATTFDKVKQKLSCTVILESTGECIANPLEKANLAGMFQILKSEYFTANLVQFNKDLQDTLRISISRDELLKTPTKAIQLTDKWYDTWQTMKYWNYMDEDIFFVNVLLMSMPYSDFQQKCVMIVGEYITKKQRGELNDDLSIVTLNASSKLPIYRHLCEYIRLYENSSRLKTSTTHTTVNPNPLTLPGTFNGRRGNVETAHLVGTQYGTVIERDKGYKCKDVDTGFEHPYTATNDACPQCYGKSTGEKVEPHRPKCYFGSCRTCGLFGHKMVNCMQHTATYKKGPTPLNG